MAHRALLLVLAPLLAFPIGLRAKAAAKHPDFTDITRSMETQRGNVEMTSREMRSLDEGGRTMTVRTTLDPPRGKQTMTVTYAKVDD